MRGGGVWRPWHAALLEALMHARSTDDCTLAVRADGLDGNGSGSAGCGAYVGRGLHSSTSHLNLCRFCHYRSMKATSVTHKRRL